MAQATWEKVNTEARSRRSSVQWKFIIGGMVLFGAIAYLIVSQSVFGAQYFISVKDLLATSQYVGKTVRISGAVVGDTIKYDSQKLIIDFSIANIPANADNESDAVYQAANDPKALRLSVHVENQVKPDLLKHEAQAILTGKLGSDGVFQATELLLKCPSRFQESDTSKIVATPGGK